MKIFISYSNPDVEMALLWEGLLTQCGYEVARDDNFLEAGDDLPDAIKKEIKSSDHVIVLWSRSSVESEWVRAEAHLAYKLKKFRPFIIDEISSEDIPLPFNRRVSPRISNPEKQVDSILRNFEASDSRQVCHSFSVDFERIKSPERLSTLVVLAEPLKGSKYDPTLLHVDVRRALRRRPQELLTAAKLLLEQAAPLPTGSEAPRRIEMVDLPERLDVAGCFRSWTELERSIELVCRADVAVFDLTGLQPGVLFLLGIRAVARRGVTICTVGDRELGFDADLPFNLQLVNVSGHRRARTQSRAEQPHQVLARKILSGLQDLAERRDYLDLPAFSAIRSLARPTRLSGTGGGAQHLEITYGREILVLNSFDEKFSLDVWPSFKSSLEEAVMEHWRIDPDEADAAEATLTSGGDYEEPHLKRLLEPYKSRLVMQTLYEAIRFTQMCVVDWTDFRPNVMYELGVRVAVHRLGAVSVASKGSLQMTTLRHVADMAARFEPIAYDPSGVATEPFGQMVSRFIEAQQSAVPERDIYSFVGRSIGDTLDADNHSVVDELLDSAYQLSSVSDMAGETNILFQEPNKRLAGLHEQAAMERQIAAWLYIDRRYEPETILGAPTLRTHYAGQTARKIIRRIERTDKSLAKYMRERINRLASRDGGTA